MEKDKENNTPKPIPNAIDKGKEKANVPNLRFSDENWILTTFGKTCKGFQYGLGAEAVPFDGSHKYIRITDIDEDTSNYNPPIPVSPSYYDDRYIVCNNDILFARTGASTGKTYLYNKKDGSLYFAGFLIRANVIKHFNSKFIFQITKTSKYKNWVNIMSARSGQPGINSKEYQSFKYYIPSRPIQDKIADFLSIIDQRIETQSKIIEALESLICTLRIDIFSKYDWEWNRLDLFIKNGTIILKRGNIIPKHGEDIEYIYPVYSSSIHSDGLMGFNNTYMFDKELITWSIDGGGNFFYRHKHKFNVTNVCGILEVTDNSFNYRFLSEILSAQHSKMVFDYQTKAHPSVIEKLYKLPIVDIRIQDNIALIFELCYQKLQKEKDILTAYKKQKAYLLQNMFI